MTKYIWDENKRRKNLAKHGLDFKDAYQAFEDHYCFFDVDPRYDGDRWILIGSLLDKTIVLIAYTEPLADVYRILTMREATRKEMQRHEKERESQIAVREDPLMLLMDKIFSE